MERDFEGEHNEREFRSESRSPSSTELRPSSLTSSSPSLIRSRLRSVVEDSTSLPTFVLSLFVASSSTRLTSFLPSLLSSPGNRPLSLPTLGQDHYERRRLRGVLLSLQQTPERVRLRREGSGEDEVGQRSRHRRLGLAGVVQYFFHLLTNVSENVHTHEGT